MLNKVIKIQSLFRGYNIRKKILIPSGYYQTKTWRKNRLWYKTGKSNECEIYQFNILEKILNNKILKTNERIHSGKNEIVKINFPNNELDGFEYTENFDGKIIFGKKNFYFNLKFVCDKGGAQTRTLR